MLLHECLQSQQVLPLLGPSRVGERHSAAGLRSDTCSRGPLSVARAGRVPSLEASETTQSCLQSAAYYWALKALPLLRANPARQ